MKKVEETVAHFDADHGLVVGDSVEEQMRQLIDSGYFRGVKSAVVAVSNDHEIDYRKCGPRYECLALAQYAVTRIGLEYGQEG